MHKNKISQILSNCSNALINPYSHFPADESVQNGTFILLYFSDFLDQLRVRFEAKENDNAVLPKAAIKKHRHYLMDLLHKSKNKVEREFEDIDRMPEKDVSFQKNFLKESICKITLREISKRIADLNILKSKRLRSRE